MLLKTTLAVSACLSLSGCFFFFIIPGKAIDALTGTGSHCVNESATVGGKIKLVEGGYGVVEKLHGVSSRCRDPRFPIHAKLRMEDQ